MRAFTSSLLTLLLLGGSSAVMAEIASAQTPSQSSSKNAARRRLYRPPNATQATGKSTTSARRGSACSPKTNSDLTAIAPRVHVGQTLSDTPMLVWHVPDEDSFSTRVELLAYNSAEVDASDSTSLVKETLQSQPGLMSWTLPEQHRLESGQRYWWRVIMFCNVNRPLDSVVVSADIQLGEADADFRDRLSGVSNPLEQAEQLAQAGYWYDAMGLLVGQEGNAAAEMRQGMVRSLLDFNQTAAPSNELARHSQSLEDLLQVGL